MNKLKLKIFLLSFGIFTISILSFIIIFNTKTYLEKKNSILNSLNVANSRTNFKKEIQFDNNIKFLDNTMYTILLDSYDNIKVIINHSNNNLNSNEISLIANKILTNKNKKINIGFLYVQDYSYLYNKGDSLIILDNTNIKTSLYHNLEISLIIFIILELIVFYLSKFLSSIIVKPVKETFDKQKEFIADASHELKTPLSVIVASSEALKKEPKSTKWLNNIQIEAERMNMLISDLLELASSEKITTFDFNFANFSKTIELSLLTFEGKVFEAGNKLSYDIEDEIQMNFDDIKIRQLSEILLDNAIKHSEKNTEIKVKLFKENNNIIFEVINKGEEIPKGEEEKIFERFYRLDKSRNRKDNRYGLGLAIAKNIVTNHNGCIKAYSSNGFTTFKVIFKK